MNLNIKYLVQLVFVRISVSFVRQGTELAAPVILYLGAFSVV